VTNLTTLIGLSLLPPIRVPFWKLFAHTSLPSVLFHSPTKHIEFIVMAHEWSCMWHGTGSMLWFIDSAQGNWASMCINFRLAIYSLVKVVFPQLGGAPLFIVRWWLSRDSYRSTCEWDGQPTINTLVCQHESRYMIERLEIRKGAPSGCGKDFSIPLYFDLLMGFLCCWSVQLLTYLCFEFMMILSSYVISVENGRWITTHFYLFMALIWLVKLIM
jgi:hypothetical protein